MFNKIDSGGKIQEIIPSLITFLKLNLIVWTAIIIFVSINLKWIIEYIFDPKYLTTISLIQIWFVLLYVQVIKNVFEPIARTLEFTKVYLFTFIAAVLNFFGNLVLVPTFGIYGALISTGVSILLQGLGISYFVSKRIGIKIEIDQLFLFLGRIFLLAALVVQCNKYITKSPLEFLISNLICLFCFAVLFYPARWFTEDQRSYLFSFFPKFRLNSPQ